VLVRLIATCPRGSLRDLGDQAILMVAFGSRRLRSEIASLHREQISLDEPVVLKDGTSLPFATSQNTEFCDGVIPLLAHSGRPRTFR
jgi:hypothetical protein